MKMKKTTQNDLSGDVTQAFMDYSHDLSLDLLLKALKNFRPNYPQDQIKALLQMIESFSCNRSST